MKACRRSLSSYDRFLSFVYIEKNNRPADKNRENKVQVVAFSYLLLSGISQNTGMLIITPSMLATISLILKVRKGTTSCKVSKKIARNVNVTKYLSIPRESKMR